MDSQDLSVQARACRTLVAGLLSLAVIGCGGGELPNRQAVRGTVLLDNKPLADATIQFIPRSSSSPNQTVRGAAAFVSAGKFQLDQTTGPTPGEFDIAVVPDAPELSEAIDSMNAGNRDPLRSRTVPLKYQQPGELHETVTADGENEFTFHLKSR